MITNKEKLIEQCTDILHEENQLCILTSISNTGYPFSAVIKPAGGIAIETIYFILQNNTTIVTNFEKNSKGSIIFYKGDDSVHLIGEVAVISSKTPCEDEIDEHFLGDVAEEDVLLKFIAHEAHINIDEQYYTLQM